MKWKHALFHALKNKKQKQKNRTSYSPQSNWHREKNKLEKEGCASSINYLIVSLKNKEPQTTFWDSLEGTPGGLSCAANVVRCCPLLLLCCWFPKQRSTLLTFWFLRSALLFDLPVQNLSESTKCNYILEWILCMSPQEIHIRTW